MNIAFKEWALVCGALGRGDQSLIIRKGGIAEGRDGFCFKHDAFYLFPTFFHEQLSRTVLPERTVMPTLEPGRVKIELLVRVEWTQRIADWETVRHLAPFHVWRQEVISERFHYDKPDGVHVAVVRVFRLEQPWIFPDGPDYGGCRSWLTLPDPPESPVLSPVLDDTAHARRVDEIRSLLSS